MNNETKYQHERSRLAYQYFYPIETRWADTDMFGHINNVKYYEYYDTAANALLMDIGGYKPHLEGAIAYVVNSSCSYFAGIEHPSKLEIGFKVNRIGRTSVTYGLAVFLVNEDQARAAGDFTHVFVERDSGIPTAIPSKLLATVLK